MANQVSSPINTGLPALPDTDDPKLFGALLRVYNAIKILQGSFTSYAGADAQPSGDWSQIPIGSTILSQNLERLYVQTTAAINVGGFVNLYLSGGVLKCQLADQSVPLQAHGFLNAPAIVAPGDYCEIILFRGNNTHIAGLTPGTIYYLGTVGNIVAVPPGAGLVQPVGIALTATILNTNIAL